ncbi:SprT-like domain-containing protein [Flagellimonas nanhaiensis]|uniref:SprT domain-containing protein n=1 Tax=Flagellimonas nanhaiensis TaxID=2292706 RepID=A0A371JVX9_9FLAO|nr:SprT-like domain-containing protein [Allomuricauda nanhaiensis]RDY61978.1 sprT domain-containing protein [Allomuricauda nanhaiensis]
MNTTLQKYLPERAIEPCFELIKKHGVHLKVVNHRVTRHGDYRRMPNGLHQITVNASLNKYRFLITLIHEIAHLVAFETYGRRIKPHGLEWKRTFQHLMVPFIRPEVFPSKLLPIIAHHFKNPKASSSTDARLSIALKSFDSQESDKSYVYELPMGSVFRLYNGRLFKKGKKKVKRYECVELSSGRLYLFQPNAEVELINDTSFEPPF